MLYVCYDLMFDFSNDGAIVKQQGFDNVVVIRVFKKDKSYFLNSILNEKVINFNVCA